MIWCELLLANDDCRRYSFRKRQGRSRQRSYHAGDNAIRTARRSGTVASLINPDPATLQVPRRRLSEDPMASSGPCIGRLCC